MPDAAARTTIPARTASAKRFSGRKPSFSTSGDNDASSSVPRFSTAQVSEIAGVSLRCLQWCCETGFVKVGYGPNVRRKWTAQDAFKMSLYGELSRLKGLAAFGDDRCSPRKAKLALKRLIGVEQAAAEEFRLIVRMDGVGIVVERDQVVGRLEGLGMAAVVLNLTEHARNVLGYFEGNSYT